ncbi:tetratricopeptide repeat-containing glycosyltransferase family 2 protein [Kineococcus glutinatus]|uniref:Glycosyltransferase 2-like domain-containing protein n=1 Tax=Kineococcus glutinatus TaxID=1070872 RepID=A0ABP9HAC2_9ACTN
MAPQPPASELLLSACLVVRDEAARIGACLDALTGLADEVVVHDTGSTDGTLDALRRRDVVLVEGTWADDFAAARNTALRAAHGEWVLSLDADEVATADGPALRARLATCPERRLLVTIVNEGPAPAGGYAFTAVRLFRREGARWRGRVHERVVHEGVVHEGVVPGAPAEGALPEELLTLQHSGYATAEALQRKGRRNAALAQRALDELLASADPDPRELAALALDLGRASMGAGQLQRAVDAFEAVRDATGAGLLWQQATDYLARLLLGAGQPDVALVLAEQLRGSGAGAEHCDWLRAQALAQLGRVAEALDLLAGITRLVDTAGRRQDLRLVEELRVLCREVLAAAPRAPTPPG